MLAQNMMRIARGSRIQLVPALCAALLFVIWAIRLQMPNFDWIATATGSADDGGISTPETTLGYPKVHGLGRPAISDIDLSDPDAPFIAWPLKRACSEVTEWTEGVVWICDNNWGGVGNVRNLILTCIRYAIEAGVSAIVLPQIQKRKETNIAKIWDNYDYRPFSYMFDEQHFRDAMGNACPQIKIYDTWADIPNAPVSLDTFEPVIEKIDPREFSDRGRCDFGELDHHSDRFGGKFRAWVSNNTSPSTASPRLFRMADPPGVIWEWPVYRDGPELANTFGHLLKFNKQVLRLGKKALENMNAFVREHNRAWKNQQRPGGSAFNGSEKDAFLGVHLRTEADAQSFWPTYEEQEQAYLGKAKEMGFTVAYVACGNLSEARKFESASYEKLRMSVVSKNDLLKGADLEELHSLSWDQQGLVDFFVLVASEYFVGNSRSSFSIFVSKRRHLRSEGLYTRPYKVRPGGFGQSAVVGPLEQYYFHWLFIWDSMWP